MPTIDAQQQSILRRRQLAQSLQQISMEPIQSPGIPGAKTSQWEGVAKLAQALTGALQNRKLDKEQAALSTKQDNERLAQALSMSNSVVPQAPGPVAPQPVAGQPMPELSPQAPAQVQPPPGLEDSRQRTVKALARALSSSDPQMAKVGEMMTQGYISGSEADKERIARMAESLGNRDFQQAQQARSEAFQGRESAASRAQAMDLANRPKPFTANAGDVFGAFDPQTGKPEITGSVPSKPSAPPQDPFQTREVTRGNKVYIQTYAKDDPQAKTISEVEKGPKTDNGESGSYQYFTDAQGHVTGAANAKSGIYKSAAQLGIGNDAQKNATSPERQKMVANAQSGLRAVEDFRKEIAQPGVLAAMAIPGSPTARKARAARNEMIDVLTRLRTGAALNKDEQAFYTSQAPGLIDALMSDPDTINYKLSIFENEFKALAGEAPKQSGPKPPAVGEERGGYKFKGGDPSKQENWTK